jgi:hypothetical protein
MVINKKIKQYNVKFELMNAFRPTKCVKWGGIIVTTISFRTSNKMPS